LENEQAEGGKDLPSLTSTANGLLSAQSSAFEDLSKIETTFPNSSNESLAKLFSKVTRFDDALAFLENLANANAVKPTTSPNSKRLLFNLMPLSPPMA
jgi:hypothetical protein